MLCYNHVSLLSRLRQAGPDGQRESVRRAATEFRQKAEEPTGRHDDGGLYRGLHQTKIAQAGRGGGAEKRVSRWRTSLALRHRRGHVERFRNERESVPVEGDLRGPGTPSEQLRPDRRNAEAVLHVSHVIRTLIIIANVNFSGDTIAK